MIHPSKNSLARRLGIVIYRFVLYNFGFLVYGNLWSNFLRRVIPSPFSQCPSGIWDLRGGTALRVLQSDLKLELERSLFEHQTYDQLEEAAWRKGWVNNTTH